jgi:hypothetical protein
MTHSIPLADRIERGTMLSAKYTGPTAATEGTPASACATRARPGMARSTQARPSRAKKGTKASETGQPKSHALS